MKTSLLFALSSSLLFAAPALAAGPAEQVVERVRVADLDLATAAGRKVLDGRIRQAASTACGQTSSADLAGSNALERCRADARSRAHAQVETALAATRQARALAAR